MELMKAYRPTLEQIRSMKQDAPCVSIYISKPNGRLPAEVPSVQLYKEFSYARGLLESSMSPRAAADYLKPLWLVARDELLKEDAGSIALFKSGDVAACARLPEMSPARTVVADDFHVKPFIKHERAPEPDSLRWALELCHRSMRGG